MSKRVIVEFICDVCSQIVAIEQYADNPAGRIATTQPYPKGWKRSTANSAIDICPDCPMPVAEEVSRGKEHCTQKG